MKTKIKILINYFIALSSIIFQIFPIKDKKKKYFFINSEGGFGPSITRTHLVNTKFNENWILFFGTKNKRHNKKIAKIFDGKLKFFSCGDLNFPKHKDNFEKFVIKMMLFIFRIKIRTVESLILNLELEDLDENKTNDQKIFRRMQLFETGFFLKKQKMWNFIKIIFIKKIFQMNFKN